MYEKLIIVYLEDNPADAELVEREILSWHKDVNIRHVMTYEEYCRTLNDFIPDIILSDFLVPGFHDMESLDIAKKEHSDIPFIYVSGAIGEERAIETMKKGAMDYVLKDNLKRLTPAIERALRTIAIIEEKKKAERERAQYLDDLNERIKELNCLYRINEIGKDRSLTIEQILEKTLTVIPAAYRSLDNTSVRIACGSGVFLTENFAESLIFQKRDLCLGKELHGSIEVFIQPDIVPTPEFLTEEDKLINAIADTLSGIILRKIFEDTILSQNQEIQAAFEDLQETTEELEETNAQLEDTVNELQRVNKDLEKSQARLKEAQEIARIGDWEYDIASDSITWSEQVFKLYERDPRLGNPTVQEEAAYYDEVTASMLRELARRSIEEKEDASYDFPITLPGKRKAYFQIWIKSIINKKGDALKIIGTVQDITERVKAEEALYIKDIVFESSIAAQCITDNEGVIHTINNAFMTLWGYERKEDICGRPMEDFFKNPADAVPMLHALKERGCWDGEFLAQRKDGTTFISHGLVTALMDKNGLQIGVQSTNLDITPLRSAENEAKQHAQETEELLHCTKIILEMASFEKTAREIFNSCKEIVGARSGYVALLSEDGKENEVLFLDLGDPPFTVNPAPPVPIRGPGGEAYRLVRSVYDNKPHDSEWMKYIPQGYVRLDNALFTPLIIENVAVGLIGLTNKPGGFDDFDVHSAEAYGELAAIALFNSMNLKKLESNLHEKEAMLKEIHHRVKNNLQLISSMLGLQQKHIKDGNDLEVIKDCRTRIRSMALVHEKIYTSKDFAFIDFSDFIRMLINDLPESQMFNTKKIEISINAESCFLDVTTAIPCAQIITELVSNSLKHAFPDGRKGRINIELMKNNGSYRLAIGDDGVGPPEDFTFPSENSLGLILVDAFVRQLKGSVEITSDPGLKYTIIFKGKTHG